jgi:hypothetical protein
MNKPQLLREMTDAYIARRRKGVTFDDTAATQAYWECQPQMSEAQVGAFTDIGRGNGPDGWKVVLRDQLARREAGDASVPGATADRTARAVRWRSLPAR